MSNPIVIKIRNGQLETLRNKDFDIGKLGRFEVRRSSEILFDADEQKYYIHFLDAEIQHMNPLLRNEFYPTYEAAVDREVSLINEARKAGVI